MFYVPFIVYIFVGLGVGILLTLIPNKKKKLRNTIEKYVGEKEAGAVVLKKLEKSFLIRIITPTKGTIKYDTETNKLRKSGIKINLEKLSILKVVTAVVLFIVFFSIQLNLSTLKEKGVLSVVSGNGNAATMLFGDSASANKSDNLIYDILLNEVLKEVSDYKKYFKQDKIEELATKIAIIREGLGIDDVNDIYAKKVAATMEQAYSVSLITKTNIIILICLSLLATGVVDMYLGFKRSIRTRKIAKEFEKIEAVTILLLNKKSINLISLLNQMKQQSKLLRPYIQECLNTYTSDPYKALEGLVDNVNNTEFTKFINILKQCLSSDKDTNAQILRIQRKLRIALQETVNKQVNKNKRLRLTMLQFPLILLLILLILLPFLDIIQGAI